MGCGTTAAFGTAGDFVGAGLLCACGLAGAGGTGGRNIGGRCTDGKFGGAVASIFGSAGGSGMGHSTAGCAGVGEGAGTGKVA
jgi:hypothetical protein